MEWLETLAGEEGARFLPVVDMIEQAAADPEWADHVSLLGLTCGTGKSSAISLLIAETVHAVKECGSEEGLLIVTDRKKAMKEYLEPTHIPKLKTYLDQSADMISRLDDETHAVEKERFWRCPVLLMTYARYFGSEETHIRNTYLKWGGGCQRTRIIMDEEPPIVESKRIGYEQISKADGGIRDGLRTETVEERRWCLEVWEKIRDRLYEVLEGHVISLYTDRQDELFQYRPKEAILPGEDLERFKSYIHQSHSTLLETDLDLPMLLEEIQRIVVTGGYGEAQKKQAGNLSILFRSVRNHGDIMQGMDAKILILDGTAAISNAYDHEYIHQVQVDGINVRKFPELTINLVNLNTSKAAFKKRTEEIVQTVTEYLDNAGENSQDFTVITYKGKPEEGFRNSYRYADVEHIGNIRGRNDLSESCRAAQAGLLRKPPLVYVLELLDSIEEKAHGEENLSSAIWEYPEENIDGYLRSLLDNEAQDTYDRMINAAAADFEQNVFRTAIRKPDNNEPVTYYLFADTDYFSKLVGIVEDRFHNKYGSKVNLPDPQKEMAWKIRGRKGGSAASRLIRWLAERKAGETFKKAAMLMGADLSENQFSSLKKDHPEIAEWFRRMNEAVPAGQPKKGYYIMLPEILEQLR